MRAQVLIQALEQFAPDILEVTQQAVEAQKLDRNFIHLDADAFAACRAQSIGYAMLEQHTNVAAKIHPEQVKDIVAGLQKNLSLATEHRHAPRPWGEYDALDEGYRFRVKRITVRPDASLSLQFHHHRAEHWIVVKGTARVARDH